MTNFDIKYTGQTSPNNAEQAGNATAKALKIGLGFQYLLSKHLSLRAELDYLTYQKLNVALYPEKYNVNLKLSGQQIVIGVLYTL